MHILHVAGAGPNLMKVAPVMTALGRRSVRQTLVHTGQHYDVGMSEAIFRALRRRTRTSASGQAATHSRPRRSWWAWSNPCCNGVPI
jgi:UDP-N-acetylglucosamine 2-epimerase